VLFVSRALFPLEAHTTADARFVFVWAKRLLKRLCSLKKEEERKGIAFFLSPIDFSIDSITISF